MEIKLLCGLVLVALFSVGLSGCKKNADPAAGPAPSQPETPEAEIRTAIQAHLAHKGNLNLQAFETQIKQVAIQSDHAQAQVEFRVKNGPGAMDLTYQLEKRAGAWTVMDSNPVGSNFSHPPLDQAQSPGANVPEGVSHSLSDTLKSFKQGGVGSSQPLPPGHPRISSQSGTPMTE